jgi:hypothetical protein
MDDILDDHEHTEACFTGPYGHTVYPRCGAPFNPCDLEPMWWASDEEREHAHEIRERVRRRYHLDPKDEIYEVATTKAEQDETTTG